MAGSRDSAVKETPGLAQRWLWSTAAMSVSKPSEFLLGFLTPQPVTSGRGTVEVLLLGWFMGVPWKESLTGGTQRVQTGYQLTNDASPFENTHYPTVFHGALSALADSVSLQTVPFSLNAVYWLLLRHVAQQIHPGFPPQRSPFSTSHSVGCGSCSPKTEGCAVFSPELALFSRGLPKYEQAFCSAGAPLTPFGCFNKEKHKV